MAIVYRRRKKTRADRIRRRYETVYHSACSQATQVPTYSDMSGKRVQLRQCEPHRSSTRPIDWTCLYQIGFV